MNNKIVNHYSELPNSLTGSMPEWVQHSAMLNAYKNNENTVTEDISWMLPAGMDFNAVLRTHFTRYNSMSDRHSLIFFDWGYAYANVYSFKLSISFCGPQNRIKEVTDMLDGKFRRTESTIEWHYANGRGTASVGIPLNYKKTHDSFYPWIKTPINQYFADYFNSDATVLVLIGPPGTGKTSFIKAMLHYTKSNAMVTYDEALMGSDAIFVNFINEDTNFLIMEDADTFLGARTDGNAFMHKFLNISDGLVSSAQKKIVFSTNLPSAASIDDALLRKGRCYDIVQFRYLTRDEAVAASRDMGQEFTGIGNEFSLAELFHGKTVESPAMQKMGF